METGIDRYVIVLFSDLGGEGEAWYCDAHSGSGSRTTESTAAETATSAAASAKPTTEETSHSLQSTTWPSRPHHSVWTLTVTEVATGWTIASQRLLEIEENTRTESRTIVAINIVGIIDPRISNPVQTDYHAIERDGVEATQQTKDIPVMKRRQ